MQIGSRPRERGIPGKQCGKEPWGAKGSSPKVFTTSPRPFYEVMMQHNESPGKYYFTLIPTSGLKGRYQGHCGDQGIPPSTVRQLHKP